MKTRVIQSDSIECCTGYDANLLCTMRIETNGDKLQCRCCFSKKFDLCTIGFSDSKFAAYTQKRYTVDVMLNVKSDTIDTASVCKNSQIHSFIQTMRDQIYIFPNFLVCLFLIFTQKLMIRKLYDNRNVIHLLPTHLFAI